MIDKETYKKELKRMFDSLSGGNKSTDRCGIKCSQCPLKKICNNNIYAFDIIEAVEKWSNENKHKLSKLEYDILEIFQYTGSYHTKTFEDYFLTNALLVKGYFKGATKDMSIKDYLDVCEVTDDV